MKQDPIMIAQALHRALEAGSSGEDLRSRFHPEARTVEHPNALKPGGATTALEEMLAASVAGVQMLRHQSYDVKSAVAVGQLAILRLTWTGVLARDVGPFRDGQQLIAHVAQFVETEDGLIRSIETYDCYEPFDAPS